MISLRSKITREVLSFFTLHPEAELYINELARRLNLDSGNLTRKLGDLEKEGILASEQRGKQRYYFLNSNFPLLDEYKKIILSTVGFEAILTEALTKVDGIKQAIIFGSYAKNQMNAASDIDLMVIGEHNTISLQKMISKLQKSIDREINLISMGTKEFEQKKKTDSFVKSILNEKRVKLI